MVQLNNWKSQNKTRADLKFQDALYALFYSNQGSSRFRSGAILDIALRFLLTKRFRFLW